MGAPAALRFWDVVEVRPQAVAGVGIIYQGADHVGLVTSLHGVADGAVGESRFSGVMTRVVTPAVALGRLRMHESDTSP